MYIKLKIIEPTFQFIFDKFIDKSIWNTNLAVARALLAIGLMATLLFNETSLIFPNPTVGAITAKRFLQDFSFFSLLSTYPIWSKWIAIFILTVCLLGFLPRVMCLLHWWITYSFYVSAAIIDGGDQIALVLTTLLIPIGILDNRINHWSSTKVDYKKVWLKDLVYLIGSIVLLLIALQMSALYFQAATSKFVIEEWSNGTAIYYWFLNPLIGLNQQKIDLIKNLIQDGYVVTFLTWVTLLFEILLFTALFYSKKWKKNMFFFGLLFHFFIIWAFGLFSFFFAMAAGLTLYLQPFKAE